MIEGPPKVKDKSLKRNVIGCYLSGYSQMIHSSVTCQVGSRRGHRSKVDCSEAAARAYLTASLEITDLQFPCNSHAISTAVILQQLHSAGSTV